MQIRDPGYSGSERDSVDPSSPLVSVRAPNGAEDEPGHGTQEWRVPPGHVKLKIISAIVLGLVTVTSLNNPTGLLILGLGTALVTVLAVRDLLAPVRLTAGLDGIRVLRGFAHLDQLTWSDVQRIRVDRCTRLGRSSQSVEIDTGSMLYLLSTHDVGAPVEEVVETLLTLWESATHHCE